MLGAWTTIVAISVAWAPGSKTPAPAPASALLELISRTRCLARGFPEQAERELTQGLMLERDEVERGVKFAVDGPVSENDRFLRVWDGVTDKGRTRVITSMIDFKEPLLADSVLTQVIISGDRGVTLAELKSSLGVSRHIASSTEKGAISAEEKAGGLYWKGSHGPLELEIERYIDSEKEVVWRVKCVSSRIERSANVHRGK